MSFTNALLRTKITCRGCLEKEEMFVRWEDDLKFGDGTTPTIDVKNHLAFGEINDGHLLFPAIGIKGKSAGIKMMPIHDLERLG